MPQLDRIRSYSDYLLLRMANSYEIRSAVEDQSRKRERIDAQQLTPSMPALPTGDDARHFGALHLVSQPPPGLSHGEPKGLVSVGLRRACHHYTLLDQVFVNSDLHCTIPFVRTCRRYEQ